MGTQGKQYWEHIYATKPAEQVSWFQPYPKTSMELVETYNLPLSANIIDVGGGDSLFAAALLEKGYQNIWVLDISANAIERAREGLGQRASEIHWIVSDIVDFTPAVSFDLWHDRAAFHFLTSENKIAKYVSIAKESIAQDGYLLVGTFSEKGPKKCSGLNIMRYSEASMSARFDPSFSRIKCLQENHTTPFKTVQNFLFCSFKKKK